MEGVMAVHDEVMPKMGQIAKLSSALKPLADASPEGPEAKALEDLKVAHEAMMTWMKEIGDTFTHEEIMKGAALSDEKKEALRIEADKIAEVKDLMLKYCKRRGLIKGVTNTFLYGIIGLPKAALFLFA